MKHYILYIIVVLFALSLAAQQRPEVPQPPLAFGGNDSLIAANDSLDLTPDVQPEIVSIDTIYAGNDSVVFGLTLHLTHLTITPSETLTAGFVLTDSTHSVCLPPVVMNGHRRAAYDERERALDYHHKFYIDPYCILRSDAHGNFPQPEVVYIHRMPYANWMSHASLRMSLTGKECCETYSLTQTELTPDLNLPDLRRTLIVERWHTDTIYIAAVAAQPTLIVPASKGDSVSVGEAPPAPASRDSSFMKSLARAEAETGLPTSVPVYRAPSAPALDTVSCRPCPNVYRLWFEQNNTRIDSTYECNTEMLVDLDSVIVSALTADSLAAIRIVSCSSPDGTYIANDSIARHRAAIVVNHLRRHYPQVTAQLLTPVYNVENWDGLLRLLRATTYPWSTQAQNIIRFVPINRYREASLMRLQGGIPYREMYRALFPLLRYVDVEIEYKSQIAEHDE